MAPPLAAAAPLLVCLSFNFTLCSVFTPKLPSLMAPGRSVRALPLQLKPRPVRGCTLGEWRRATAVIGTAVARPFSISPVFCNTFFCYRWPKLLNRFRPIDKEAEPEDIKCANVMLQKDAFLFPVGSPDESYRVFAPYKAPRHMVADDQDNTASPLGLCVDASQLPPFPFNSSLIKGPPRAKELPKADDNAILEELRSQSHLQGLDAMSRQFAEVLINIGVEQVNSQKYAEAIKTFNMIIGKAGLSAGVLVGRGTALALAGNLEEAIKDYTRAIELEPQLADAWRRRGQARTAVGDIPGAIEDLSRSMELLRAQGRLTMDLVLERAMMHLRVKDSYNAAKDLRSVLAVEPQNVMAINMLGQVLVRLGEAEEASQLAQRLVRMMPQDKMAWVQLGDAQKELGQVLEAFDSFRTALKFDPGFAPAYRLMASLYYGLGDHRNSLEMASKAVEFEPSNVESHYIKGSSHQALGDLGAAVYEYDQILSLPSSEEQQPMQFASFYQREVTSYTAMSLMIPFSTFDIERTFSAQFKECWARSDIPTKLFPGYNIQPPRAALDHPLQPEHHVSPTVATARMRLIKAADVIGRRIQYSSRGFLPNRRQHRAAGMAAIEVMQALRAAWGIAGTSQDRDEDFDDAEEEDELDFTGPSTVKGWRDLYSIVARWRSIADPTDAVLWIDRFTSQQFEEGFGSVTTMVQGHAKNTRYYSQFPRAFSLLKEEILDRGQVLVSNGGSGEKLLDLNPELGTQIEYAESSKDLWEAVGENFHLVAPVYSAVDPEYTLNGTRLSVLSGRGGFEFSIKTALTPSRWREYDEELSAAWTNLRSVIGGNVGARRKANPSEYKKKVLEAVLRVAFYWYHLMPLTRGTAGAGYIGVLGMLLAADVELTADIPQDVQVDWDAILSTTLEDFVVRVSAWMLPSLRTPPSVLLQQLPKVHLAFPNVASIIRLLSGAYD